MKKSDIKAKKFSPKIENYDVKFKSEIDNFNRTSTANGASSNNFGASLDSNGVSSNAPTNESFINAQNKANQEFINAKNKEAQLKKLQQEEAARIAKLKKEQEEKEKRVNSFNSRYNSLFNEASKINNKASSEKDYKSISSQYGLSKQKAQSLLNELESLKGIISKDQIDKFGSNLKEAISNFGANETNSKKNAKIHKENNAKQIEINAAKKRISDIDQQIKTMNSQESITPTQLNRIMYLEDEKKKLENGIKDLKEISKIKSKVVSLTQDELKVYISNNENKWSKGIKNSLGDVFDTLNDYRLQNLDITAINNNISEIDKKINELKANLRIPDFKDMSIAQQLKYAEKYKTVFVGVNENAVRSEEDKNLIVEINKLETQKKELINDVSENASRIEVFFIQKDIKGLDKSQLKIYYDENSKSWTPKTKEKMDHLYDNFYEIKYSNYSYEEAKRIFDTTSFNIIQKGSSGMSDDEYVWLKNYINSDEARSEMTSKDLEKEQQALFRERDELSRQHNYIIENIDEIADKTIILNKDDLFREMAEKNHEALLLNDLIKEKKQQESYINSIETTKNSDDFDINKSAKDIESLKSIVPQNIDLKVKDELLAVYQIVNNKDISEEEMEKLKENQDEFEFDYLSQMNDEEREVFNYYINKNSYSLAKDFLDTFEKHLIVRQATKDHETDDMNVLEEGLNAVGTGFVNLGQGIGNFFKGIAGDEDVFDNTYQNVRNQLIKEDWSESSIEVLGINLGGLANDLLTSTAYALPTVLLSVAIGPAGLGAGTGLALSAKTAAIVGSSIMGVSSAGNAYKEAIKSGYAVNQARAYGAMTGVVEASLQYALGGIKVLNAKSAQVAVSAIDKSLAQLALNYGKNFLSEFKEEAIQEFLSPIIKNLCLGEKNEIKLFSSEILYAGILGGFTSLALNSVSSTTTKAFAGLSDVSKGRIVKAAGQVETLKQLGESLGGDFEAITQNLSIDSKAVEIGRALNKISQGVQSEAKKLIASKLDSLKEPDADLKADLLVGVLLGENLINGSKEIGESPTMNFVFDNYMKGEYGGNKLSLLKQTVLAKDSSTKSEVDNAIEVFNENQKLNSKNDSKLEVDFVEDTNKLKYFKDIIKSKFENKLSYSGYSDFRYNFVENNYINDIIEAKIRDKKYYIDGLLITDGLVENIIPLEDFKIIRRNSIHNYKSKTLTLGKYFDKVNNYIIKAGSDSSYFDLGDSWEKIQTKYYLDDEQMFEFFNKPILNYSIKNNKQIRFSHNPLDFEASFLYLEWENIKQIYSEVDNVEYTDKDLYKEGGFWYVKRRSKKEN